MTAAVEAPRASAQVLYQFDDLFHDNSIFSPHPTFAPVGQLGDLDGDGTVGIADFLAMLAAWGPCPNPPAGCPADLDGDGDVGITDFLILLANWGP